MGKDFLLPAVVAAQRGHECAYWLLKSATVGLVKRLYEERIAGLLPYDDWESESLVVLLNAVRCFSVNDQRARFSTYYTQALINRATDLKRKESSQKEHFRGQMIPYETVGSTQENIQISGENPEELFLLKDTLERLVLRKGQTYAIGVARLSGHAPLKKRLTGQEKRQLEQVQYHFKKVLQDALLTDRPEIDSLKD
ncbi:hypothetical protein [Fructobacillus parabroussonetiae]|uniref:ComX n=1 Tax=Fructobacillus parabroussonetiae TaxID=2713174 RepID=A0ABS5QVH0_9LACO|nr:hypothetical protein [Fructobacillus parabroussonetiae]MBS9336922.1 hypothetical protein [Fructobacillus parabroussonetiae]